MPTYSEYRARARESLRGNWGAAVVTTLVFYVLCGVLGLINLIPVLGVIVIWLLTGPLMLGFYAYFMELVRTGRPNTGTIFSGFSRFGDAFLLYLLISIFTALWALLFVIPGIIAAIRYSQAYYILKDNPSIGALEAIRRSKAMMAGHKGRYFVLCLTFIGWAILAAIPAAIGYLWLAPYIYTTLVHFHEDLKARTVGYGAPPAPDSPSIYA